jgi:bacterioferritin
MRAQLIEKLNGLRESELYSIAQYMNQYYLFLDCNKSIAMQLKEIAVNEMNHARMLALQIVKLGGTPVTVHQKTIARFTTIKEALLFNEHLEKEGVAAYQDSIACSNHINEPKTRNVLEWILETEKRHVEFFGKISGKL